MGETEKNLQAALAKLGEISRKGIDRAKETISQSSHQVKLRLELTALQKDRRRALAGLGEEALRAIKAGKLQTTLFEDQISNVDALDAKIEKVTAEMAQAGGAKAEEAEGAEEGEEDEK